MPLGGFLVFIVDRPGLGRRGFSAQNLAILARLAARRNIFSRLKRLFSTNIIITFMFTVIKIKIFYSYVKLEI